MNISSIAGVLFVFSTLINTGLAVWCFSCDSQHKDNSSCSDPFMEVQESNDDRLNMLIPCKEASKNEKAVCLKIKYMKDANNKTEVQRSCKIVPKTLKEGQCPEDLTDNKNGTMEYCGICDTEGCNTASGIKANMFLTLMTIIFLNLLKKV